MPYQLDWRKPLAPKLFMSPETSASLNPVGGGSLDNNTSNHVNNNNGKDSPSSNNSSSPGRCGSGVSKMIAVRVQMLDDSVTLFQVQVSKLNDPLVQFHYFQLKFVLFFARFWNNMCENCDHYRPRLWGGQVNQLKPGKGHQWSTQSTPLTVNIYLFFFLKNWLPWLWSVLWINIITNLIIINFAKLFKIYMYRDLITLYSRRNKRTKIDESLGKSDKLLSAFREFSLPVVVL